MKRYAIKEIFGPTLQGEGTFTGAVVSFLRFAGCNKWSGLEQDKKDSICSFCDTDFVGGTKMTSGEIVEKLNLIGSRIVVISGGEPTLQLDEELLRDITSNGMSVHLETNGSKSIDKIDFLIDHICVSPKQSLSQTKISGCDDLKILYPYINDDITVEKFTPIGFSRGFLQPVMNDKYEENLKATLNKLYELKTWKLSLQTHKIIGLQ